LNQAANSEDKSENENVKVYEKLPEVPLTKV
jgi:hypothetical protein